MIEPDTIARRMPCGLWLLVASTLVAVGCSSELPADVPAENPHTNLHTELADEVHTVAMDQADGGDPAAAIQTYTQAIEEKPHTVDAYMARGRLHYASGEYALAESDYNMVLRHEPRRAAGYFSRGQAQQAQGKHHQALVSYSLAIAVEPRQAKWYYLRGKAYEALADESEADGQSARAREMRGRAAQNFGIAKNLDPITDFAELEN
jgi:tetratricopeptide (TPR) repeat protein